MSYPTVTVYTRTECKLCDRVKVLLDRAGVDYEAVNIDLPEFSDARTYVTEVLGAKSVPVTVADGHDPIFGYQPEKVKRLIAALTPNEGKP